MFPANNLQCQAEASGQEGAEHGTWSLRVGFVLPLLVNKPQGDLMILEQGYYIMHLILIWSVFNFGEKKTRQVLRDTRLLLQNPDFQAQ